eukprot:403336025
MRALRSNNSQKQQISAQKQVKAAIIQARQKEYATNLEYSIKYRMLVRAQQDSTFDSQKLKSGNFQSVGMGNNSIVGAGDSSSKNQFNNSQQQHNRNESIVNFDGSLLPQTHSSQNKRESLIQTRQKLQEAREQQQRQQLLEQKLKDDPSFDRRQSMTFLKNALNQIQHEEKKKSMKKRLTQLQKNRIALNYVKAREHAQEDIENSKNESAQYSKPSYNEEERSYRNNNNRSVVEKKSAMNMMNQMSDYISNKQIADPVRSSAFIRTRNFDETYINPYLSGHKMRKKRQQSQVQFDDYTAINNFNRSTSLIKSQNNQIYAMSVKVKDRADQESLNATLRNQNNKFKKILTEQRVGRNNFKVIEQQAEKVSKRDQDSVKTKNNILQQDLQVIRENSDLTANPNHSSTLNRFDTFIQHSDYHDKSMRSTTMKQNHEERATLTKIDKKTLQNIKFQCDKALNSNNSSEKIIKQAQVKILKDFDKNNTISKFNEDYGDTQQILVRVRTSNSAFNPTQRVKFQDLSSTNSNQNLQKYNKNLLTGSKSQQLKRKVQLLREKQMSDRIQKLQNFSENPDEIDQERCDDYQETQDDDNLIIDLKTLEQQDLLQKTLQNHKYKEQQDNSSDYPKSFQIIKSAFGQQNAKIFNNSFFQEELNPFQKYDQDFSLKPSSKNIDLSSKTINPLLQTVSHKSQNSLLNNNNQHQFEQLLSKQADQTIQKIDEFEKANFINKISVKEISDKYKEFNLKRNIRIKNMAKLDYV